MGGNKYDEDLEKHAAPVEVPAQPQPQPEQVDLLVCTCGDCTHWELGPDFILCKTCGHKFDATIVVPEHDKLVWQKHAR